ncbi:hypothetical protein [Halalkalicoccus salilacus]|uniref:hypothetical protein n=1 Tax=Halalkalicoccus sp. GCM10025704 TaxID=3252662 RepID=UPI0036067E8E
MRRGSTPACRSSPTATSVLDVAFAALIAAIAWGVVSCFLGGIPSRELCWR